MPDVAMGASVRKHLFSTSHASVYVVLDGASVPDLPQALWEHDPEHECLYWGELEPDMAEVAPYLVKLEPKSRFTNWVLDEGWGEHWGIFVTASGAVGLRTARKHFRRFLMVKSHEGKHLYFRYYDPRVLRAFLPTCNAEELAFVFGPLGGFMLEGEEPSVLLHFRREAGRLRTEKEPLA